MWGVCVVDAGATKTDWAIARREGGSWKTELFHTVGLNVEVEGWVRAEATLQAAFQRLSPALQGLEALYLYYYGPALHSSSHREVMRGLLAKVFAPQEVEVFHDLLGAARAAWGERRGIVAILGTGSNCAEWDGERIIRQAGGQGYLLGDEGSGADIGRHFVSALLHDEVPSDVKKAFWAWIQEKTDSGLGGIRPTSQQALRTLIYRAERPSALLAGMALFLADLQSHPWVAALVRSRLEAFTQRTWAKWPVPRLIRYVGGVAKAFDSLLREVTASYGTHQGIVGNVAEALLQYHLQRWEKGARP